MRFLAICVEETVYFDLPAQQMLYTISFILAVASTVE